MKKTILSVAIAEFIISCGIPIKAQGAIINNTNDNNKEIATVSTVCNKNEKVIWVGSKGDVVKSIQRLINYLEGSNIEEDGIYGIETYSAIVKYQAKNGLKQDGIIGKKTLEKLLSIDTNKPKLNNKNSQIVNGTKTATVEIVNELIKYELNLKEINSNTDYLIVVSKSQRQVYIYQKENNSWVNIKTFTCDIGALDTPTIEGEFYSGLKGKALKINDTYVKYFTQISGNYLFHSLPYNEKGQVVDNRLSQEISHGCVRLSLDDAKYIYDTIPAKTKIKIIK